jgi:hypothetical protein
MSVKDINWSEVNKRMDAEDAELQAILIKLVPLTTRFQELTGLKISLHEHQQPQES